MSDDLVTVFYQHDQPGRRPGIAWVAELHTPGDCPPFPVAVAWLTDFRGSPLDCVMLDFVLVPDQWRRQGLARRLVDACAARWPELELTDAISSGGEALVAALDRDAVAP